MSEPDQARTAPADDWPALPLEAWAETYATLHLWTQIVGKIRLAQAPMVTTGGRFRCMSPHAG